MAKLRILSSADQVAAHLRAELASGAWGGRMPGVLRLEAELDVNRKTIETALRQLEMEGLLASRGRRRSREIVAPGDHDRQSLKLAILVGEATDCRLDYMLDLQHRLEEAGHKVFFPKPHMLELGMNTRRIANLVARTPADAWIIHAGPREVLEWFAVRERPAIALFGRMRSLPIAGSGPDKLPALVDATRTLIRMGHRRIVLLARERRRLPKPGMLEQAFLDELAAHDLPVGDYNLPGWQESVAGFHDRLAALFDVTPPTALILDEISLFSAAQQFLGRKRLRIPEDVSLLSMDDDPTFAWYQPAVSHIDWDLKPILRRILRWTENVRCGKPDTRQYLTEARFVPGGTIGPAGHPASHEI